MTQITPKLLLVVNILYHSSKHLNNFEAESTPKTDENKLFGIFTFWTLKPKFIYYWNYTKILYYDDFAILYDFSSNLVAQTKDKMEKT